MKIKNQDTYMPPAEPGSRRPRRILKVIFWLCLGITSLLGIMFIGLIAYVAVTEGYIGHDTSSVRRIPPTGCRFSFLGNRADSLTFRAAIDGARRDDVRVDVYAPGQDDPVPVKRSTYAKYIDSEDVYLSQQYETWSEDYPVGKYRVTAVLDGRTYEANHDFDVGSWTIYVRCY